MAQGELYVCIDMRVDMCVDHIGICVGACRHACMRQYMSGRKSVCVALFESRTHLISWLPLEERGGSGQTMPNGAHMGIARCVSALSLWRKNAAVSF